MRTRKLVSFFLVVFLVLSLVSLVRAEVVIDSNSETNYNDAWILQPAGWAVHTLGQTFTNLDGTYKITSAKFYIRRDGAITGNARAKLYSHKNTWGVDGLPDALLATSDAVDVSTISDALHLETFTFSGAAQYEMAANTHYCIEFGYGPDWSAAGIWGGADSSGTHAGNQFLEGGGTYMVSAGYDVIFYVYGEEVSAGLDLTFGVAENLFPSSTSFFGKELGFTSTNTIQPSDVVSMSKAIGGVITEFLSTNTIYPTANLLFNKELAFWKYDNLFTSATSTMTKAIKLTLFELFDFVKLHASTVMLPGWTALTIEIAVAIGVLALVLAICGIGLVVLRKRRD